MHVSLRSAAALSITLLSSAGCEYADIEEVASVESALVGVDSFMYLRCNSTSWGVDAKSRMRDTGVPGLLELSFDVTESWMVSTGDDCVLTETPRLDGWGSWQRYHRAVSAPVVAPAALNYVASPPGTVQNFRIKFPELGRFRVVVDTRTQGLYIGKAGQVTAGQVAWTSAGQIMLDGQQNLYRMTVSRGTPNQLDKLDRATGRSLWTYPGDSLGFASGCAFSDTIVVAESNKRLLGIDTATGAERWASSEASGGFSSPVCHAGLGLMFVSDAGAPGVTAIRLSDGRALWFQPMAGQTWVRTAVAGAVVVAEQAPTGAIAMRGLDPATGQVLWSYEGSDAPIAGPGDTLFRVTSSEIQHLIPTSGVPAWTRAGKSAELGEPGVVYIGSGSGRLDKVSTSDNRLLWTYSWPAGSDPALRLAPGSVVLSQSGATDMTYTVLEPSSGRQRWSRRIPGDYSYLHADPLGRLFVLTAVTIEHLDEASGNTRWRYVAPMLPDYGQSHLSGVLDGDAGGVYVSFAPWGSSFAPGGLGALDPATGAARWLSFEYFDMFFVGSDASRLFMQVSSRGGYGDARAYLK